MPKNLIVDTNLLLLWIIGSIDNGAHIRSSNRLKKFNYKDFQIVNTIIGTYDTLSITPYIATEISNLIDLNGYVKEQVFVRFQILLKDITAVKVIDTDIRADISGENFLNFGLTDNSLITLINDYFILTDDDKLCFILYSVNFDNVLQYKLVKNLSSNM
ncbi:hypothetical protein P256_02622 [Acinetobacter nectaris CIP 110549]|uniref:PIN domain-containing protein n=1 Tax=Acinetobacter nectaris CIP 110549 TaxID=1392540 RepID=V2SWH0_9GAMM|nr:hypothetical protein P256_02622 [Acinetobacter nectaris CIP 110549]